MIEQEIEPFMTVREINTACQKAALGRGRYVYCKRTASDTHGVRVIRAKSEHGVFMVKSINGGWIRQPAEVYMV